MKRLLSFLLFFSALISCACSPEPGKEDPIPVPDPVEKMKILSLSFREYPGLPVNIDQAAKTVEVTFPSGMKLGNATLMMELSEGVSSRPESGSVIDLSKDNAIFLSLEDGSACKWMLKCVIAKSSQAEIRNLYSVDYYQEGRISGNEIHIPMPYGADLSALNLKIEASEGATFSPDIKNKPANLSSPIEVVVTAEDGSTTNKYKVCADVRPQDKCVRGIYLPSPSHTASFLTYDEVCKSLSLMDELNFNTLFICTWAATKTAWDSEVLLKNSSYSRASEGNMYASYRGGSGDAIRDIIDVAHSKGIKVVFWFEYGFMHGITSVNMNNPILKVHPDWIGRGSDGNYSNYNGTDFYLNAYDPAVRGFMLDLMAEGLSKYPEVDGIQGDDRLPAMPRNSGYDTWTKEAYKSATGNYPPSDYNNGAWVRWRLDILNSFATDMRTRLKGMKPSLMVCFAPNKYPWCEQNLMQDWPSWIKDGNVDLLTVQFYVTGSYRSDIASALQYIAQAGGGNILNPAMILKNGANIMSEQMLVDQLNYNRSMGTNGEAQFWFDGLKEAHVKKVFKAFYPGKAIFPYGE